MVLTGAEKFVFIDLLRMSSDLLSKYTTPQDRLFYLIFIPHLLLMIFIFMFADNAARIGGGLHKGIRALIGIGAYMSIIFMGWYGSFIAPIFVGLWQMLLALAFISFIAARFLHPTQAKELMAYGKMQGEKITAKGKAGKKLEQELERIDRVISEVAKSTTSTNEGKQYKEMQLSQLRAQRAEIKHALEEL